jgi:hypothetical protein
MKMGRPRFDLDGIPLHASPDQTMVLAILRHRTSAGLEMLMPESGDFTIPWSAVRSATVDLAAGQINIALTEEYSSKENWLRGHDRLVGRWIDRFQMEPTR